MECNAGKGGLGRDGVDRGHLAWGCPGVEWEAGPLSLGMSSRLVSPGVSSLAHRWARSLVHRWARSLAHRWAFSLAFSLAFSWVPGLTGSLAAEGSLGQRTLPVPGGWTRLQAAETAEQLTCTYQVPTFVEAVALVGRMVAPAEALGHHPDVEIRYNRVRLLLTTHDAGGLTDLDVRLARAISAIAARQNPPLRCLDP